MQEAFHKPLEVAVAKKIPSSRNMKTFTAFLTLNRWFVASDGPRVLEPNLESCGSILCIPPLPLGAWRLWPNFRDAVNSFAGCAVMQAKDFALITLCDRLHIAGDASLRGKFTETLRSNYNPSDKVPGDLVVAQCIAICRDQRKSMNAENAFLVTSHTWMWLRESPFKKTLEDDFADFMTTIWTRIIKEAQFSLRSPTIVVPAISAVLE